jgi:hypothetical protein
MLWRSGAEPGHQKIEKIIKKNEKKKTKEKRN